MKDRVFVYSTVSIQYSTQNVRYLYNTVSRTQALFTAMCTEGLFTVKYTEYKVYI